MHASQRRKGNEQIKQRLEGKEIAGKDERKEEVNERGRDGKMFSEIAYMFSIILA